MKKTRPKIGIVSVYFNRGAGYIALQIKNALLKDGCDVSILARMSNTDNHSRISFTNEFFHNNILLNPAYCINDNDFKKWLFSEKIDKIIFIEEQFTKNLIKICNDLKIESYNYVVWENINPGNLDYYRKFTKLICPTKCTYDLLKKSGLDNLINVTWGIDLIKFKYHEPTPKEKPQFLFIEGWGGVHNRKNEQSVKIAFSEILPRNKSILRIHSQKAGVEEKGVNYHKTYGDNDSMYIYKLLCESDCLLIPSKWEGNGLQQLESLAVGRPVITVDSAPMNERIHNGENGYCCSVKDRKSYPDIFVEGVEIDIKDFSEKMIQVSENKENLYNMQTKSRQIIEDKYNWAENEKDLLEGVLS